MLCMVRQHVLGEFAEAGCISRQPGNFQSSLGVVTRGLQRLENLSNNGFAWTFTAVPVGSETRMGIDRDGDGVFDEDDPVLN